MSTSRRPADIARRSAKALRAPPRDAFRRETFALPREQAREKAREMFRRFPKAAYMTEIESWRELSGDRIEKFSARIRGEKPPVGPSNHSREARGPGVSSFDEGQRPSHGLRCGHQYDRGCEHQTQQTK